MSITKVLTRLSRCGGAGGCLMIRWRNICPYRHFRRPAGRFDLEPHLRLPNMPGNLPPTEASKAMADYTTTGRRASRATLKYEPGMHYEYAI
jgi:hypothetical protein